ncbi:uncharacterized protein M421DRAFT_404771 [Didymella exigua CBS 183.55]|uniref:Rhodopsin domain-containing protein n=1 Tax=Didymella exigua CBS 183.55 TaxID=1150837 RepID=A0A6A5R9Y2_9PLEO|nr:uncharacterized protein M421DRAFT_404771 [Didymella exigua CBS 183.55]KAF1923834.1 hypothetical protein M421DRAFT_404771 [Didymella exigua CBS 183.55]
MAGLQIDIYVSIGITWLAALVALSMRMVARQLTGIKWWLDDCFSILAFIVPFNDCIDIFLPGTLHWSLGKRMPDSLGDPARQAVLYQARKLGFFNSLCYATSLAFSKMSILLFYWRLFKLSAIRLPILILLIIAPTWLIFRTFMLAFRCVPTRAIWDKSIPATCKIDGDKFFLATITTHFMLDMIILVLPMVPVCRLRMPLQQKLAVASFFLLGAIVCIASCIVLVILIRFPADTKQLPYDYATFCIWGAVEVNIAVVSGCCPLLRPVIRYICPGLFGSTWATRQTTTASGRAIRLGKTLKINRTEEDGDSSSTRNLA